jgi:hypothetical protein
MSYDYWPLHILIWMPDLGLLHELYEYLNFFLEEELKITPFQVVQVFNLVLVNFHKNTNFYLCKFW